MTLGDTPSWSARTIVGVPCMSLPPTIRTSSPFIRWYRAMTSAGMNVETAWPRCLGPDAYGHETQTRILISYVLDWRLSLSISVGGSITDVYSGLGPVLY